MSSPINLFTDFIFAETVLNKADAIFIPGSHHPQLAIKAAELYHAGYAPLLIPSGGLNKYLEPGLTEAAWLTNILLEHNVPETAVLPEPEARNTFNNADFTASLISRLGLNIRSAIIVAKGFHSRRCLLTYQTAFPKDFRFFVCTVPDGHGNTRNNWYLSQPGIETVMGEITKIGSYFAEEIDGFRQKWS